MIVQFPAGAQRVRGALFLPGDDAARAGVVVIPDVWGLAPHYEQVAQKLASAGYAALAIDLYTRGESPQRAGPQGITAFIQGLPDRQVLSDLQGAIDFLAAHPALGGRRIGVTGFCMGGMYTLLAACRCRGLSACVSFYGMLEYEKGLDPVKKPRSPLAALPDLTCPLLGLYGAEDALIPVADVRRLEQGLARSRHPGQVVLYPGAGHAFMNETRPEAFRPAVAADAWPRMVSFLRRHLA